MEQELIGTNFTSIFEFPKVWHLFGVLAVACCAQLCPIFWGNGMTNQLIWCCHFLRRRPVGSMYKCEHIYIYIPYTDPMGNDAQIEIEWNWYFSRRAKIVRMTILWALVCMISPITIQYYFSSDYGTPNDAIISDHQFLSNRSGNCQCGTPNARNRQFGSEHALFRGWHWFDDSCAILNIIQYYSSST